MNAEDGDGVWYFGSIEEAHGPAVIAGRCSHTDRYVLVEMLGGGVLRQVRRQSFDVVLPASLLNEVSSDE